MNQPMMAVIKERFSCRIYDEQPIEEAKKRLLTEYLSTGKVGPFGTSVRFTLVAANEEDRQALKGLGTYGFIRGATGFIIGAVRRAPHNMEDFGYLMEHVVLISTDCGLGTCWLGGSFTKSSFSEKIAATCEETVPAVVSIGHMADGDKGRLRRIAGLGHRLPPEQLFYDGAFGRRLLPERAGDYAKALEAVRLGPSASNKQPWRIIRDGDSWHFYLQRTKGYGKGSFIFWLFSMADLQRIDMGIAMCHFELTARELGLKGRWETGDPGIEMPNDNTEYIVSWIAGVN